MTAARIAGQFNLSQLHHSGPYVVMGWEGWSSGSLMGEGPKRKKWSVSSGSLTPRDRIRVARMSEGGMYMKMTCKWLRLHGNVLSHTPALPHCLPESSFESSVGGLFININSDAQEMITLSINGNRTHLTHLPKESLCLMLLLFTSLKGEKDTF